MHPLPASAEPFLAAIADDPEDPHPRLVFADWLEEQGRPGAALAQRWMAAGNRPWSDSSELEEWDAEEEEVHWHWFRYSEETRATWAKTAGLDEEGLLPPDLDGLGGRFTFNDPIAFWEYDSRAEAERDLCERWPDEFRPRF